MYRDTANALDEHDRGVGAILIAETLIDECDRCVTQIHQSATMTEHDRWRVVHEVHDTYPEIWRHLDRARRVLAARGANTAAFDELRPLASRAPSRKASGKGREDAPSLESGTLDDARRALAELKLVVPGADWRAIEARTDGLVRVPLVRRRRHRLLVATVVSVFAGTVFTWFLAIMPSRKPSRHETMRRELVGIQLQRKIRIDTLRAELGDRCLPTIAHDLVKELVLDGQRPDAQAFGADYTARCGADLVVEHWADAPRPGH